MMAFPRSEQFPILKAVRRSRDGGEGEGKGATST